MKLPLADWGTHESLSSPMELLVLGHHLSDDGRAEEA